MDIAVTGMSFRSAPVRLREQLAFAADSLPTVLERLQRASADSELLLLSTCNRTELYVAGPASAQPGRKLSDLLLSECTNTESDWHDLFYHHHGLQAVEHLMQVAAGLDSMVLGETEIFGQLKQAFAAACAAGTVGSALHPLLQDVFRVVKRVRTETEISVGRVSVASIAIDLADKIFEALSAKTAMIVGAGEIGEETMRCLVNRGVRNLLVLNRSPDRGQALAAQYGGTAVAFGELPERLAEADIVISSTAAPQPVIGVAEAHAAIHARHGQPMLVIDLAVPRDVAPDVAQVDNVYLYNIDDLQGVAETNLVRRQAAARAARAIIGEEAAAFSVCPCAADLALIMRHLDGLAAGIGDAELKRALSRKAVAPDTGKCQACREEIRIMLQRTVNKMLASPKRALHGASRNGNWQRYAETVKHLFGMSGNEKHDDT